VAGSEPVIVQNHMLAPTTTVTVEATVERLVPVVPA
jgi:hypothetical protein